MNLLFFILGVFFGIASFVFVFKIVFHKKDIIKEYLEKPQLAPKMRAEFIDSGSVDEDAMEILFEQAKEKGVDTKLDEL